MWYRRAETETPFSFEYGHNPQSAPNFGSQYGQDIEPAGKYMVLITPENSVRLPHWTYGKHTFRNPLIISFGGMYAEESNWKKKLQQQSGATGAKLSKILAEQGYDGIITLDENDEISEMVDISMFA